MKRKANENYPGQKEEPLQDKSLNTEQ